jgi:hypothetical protein
VKLERTVALVSLAVIAVVALLVGAFQDLAWAKDIALVAVGALAGVITAPQLGTGG